MINNFNSLLLLSGLCTSDILITTVLQHHILIDILLCYVYKYGRFQMIYILNDILFEIFRRRCSTSRDALGVRRSLSKNRPEISVREAICVTKHKSAKLYFKIYSEASLSVDCRTSLEESRHS